MIFFETPDKEHIITPIDIEFTRGIINAAAKDSLLEQNRASYIDLIGRTVYTTGSQYSYAIECQ